MKGWLQLAENRHGLLSAVVLLGAVLLANGWLLAFWLNRRLMNSGGSLSELTVKGQPHSELFQLLDIISGILFAVFALLIKKYTSLKRTSGKALVWGCLIFGLANIADAVLSLPCSETVDKGCFVPVTVNLRHFAVPSHGYTSVLLALLYFILPLAGVFYARAGNWFYKISWLTVLVALASFGSAIWEYVALHSFSVKASGVAQGLQLVVLAAWFAAWYWFVFLRKEVKKA